MIRSKNFLLTLTLCLGASTAHAEMSFVEKLRADHADKKYNLTDKRDITEAQANLCRRTAAASFATLAGYGIKAILNKYQGKPFSFPKKHKLIVATAAGLLGISLKKGMEAHELYNEYRDDLNKAPVRANKKDKKAKLVTANDVKEQKGPHKPDDAKQTQETAIERKRTAQEKVELARFIAEGKLLILEVAAVKQPKIPAQEVTEANAHHAYYGKELTEQVKNFIQRYFAREDVKAELKKFMRLDEFMRPVITRVFWRDLSDITKVAVLLAHSLYEHECAIRDRSTVVSEGIAALRHPFIAGHIYFITSGKMTPALSPQEIREIFTIEFHEGNPFLREAAQEFAQKKAAHDTERKQKEQDAKLAQDRAEEERAKAEQIATAKNPRHYTDDYIQRLYNQAIMIDQADTWDHAKANHMLKQLDLIMNNIKAFPDDKHHLKINVETAWRILQTGQLANLKIGIGPDKVNDCYAIQRQYHQASEADKAAVGKEVQAFFAPYKAALANNMQHYAAKRIIDLLNTLEHNLGF